MIKKGHDIPDTNMAMYGLNCETDKKPALLKNVYNHRWVKYSDKFGLRVDLGDLEK